MNRLQILEKFSLFPFHPGGAYPYMICTVILPVFRMIILRLIRTAQQNLMSALMHVNFYVAFKHLDPLHLQATPLLPHVPPHRLLSSRRR